MSQENWLFTPDPIAAVQEFFGLGHQAWFEGLSLLGGTWGVLLAVAIARWVWGPREAYAVLVAVVLSALLKEAMNVLVTIPRPTENGIVVYSHLQTPSFPSGHVLTAVTMWGVMARRGNVNFVVPVIVAVAICLGRLYLGAHFLIDVVAGVAAAAVLVLIFPLIWRYVAGWLEDRSYRFFVIFGVVVVAGLVANLVMNHGIPHRWSVAGLGTGLILGLLVERALTADGGGMDLPARLRLMRLGIALVAGALAYWGYTALAAGAPWYGLTLNFAAALAVTLLPLLLRPTARAD